MDAITQSIILPQTAEDASGEGNNNLQWAGRG